MEARRMLHAGEAMRGDDLRHPVVVTRGQTVTMLFHAPGVELTAMGRSMGEGGVGDTVTVQNPASFRMIAGVITAPGTVLATGPASPSLQQRTARN
jgi:flagella basal body P-ring formation protein FlgA